MGIRIPLTQNVSPGGQLAPKRAASDGTQGFRAIGQAAQVIGGIGQDIFDREQKIQRIENQRKVNQLKAGMRSTMAELDIELMDDQNPETWEKRAQERLSSFTSGAGIDELPPEAREAFDDWNAEYSSGAVLGVKRDAEVKRIRRAGDSLQNNLRGYVDNGNFLAAREEIEGSALMSPEEKRSAIMDLNDKEKDFTRREEINALEASIRSNPFEMEERIEAGEFDDLDPLDLEKAKARLGTEKNRVTGESIDAAHDGMADGSIKTAEQIDSLFPGLPPRYREKLKLDLAARAGAMSEAERSTPEYQAQAIGRVATMLDGMSTLEGEEFAGGYHNASYELSQLPDSPARRWLKEKLDAARDGREAEVKDHFDRARKAVDEMRDDKRMFAGLTAEPEKETLSIRQALDDGMLRSRKTLSASGLPPESIDIILNTTVKPKSGDVRPLRESERAELFRREYAKLPLEKRTLGNLSGLQQVVLQAVRDGKGSTIIVENITPEAEDAAISARLEAEERFGAMQMEFEEWAAVNVGASPQEIEEKLFEIGGRKLKDEFTSGKIDAAPTKGGGKSGAKLGGFVPGETSMNLPGDLSPYRKTFVEEGLRNGLDPRFLVAISQLETASGKSSAFVNKNNAMGVSDSKGPISFSTVEASISRMARVLASKNGPYKNATTIKEIAAIYAPPGAGNDPKGTNGYWATGVSKFYKELGGDPSLAVR